MITRFLPALFLCLIALSSTNAVEKLDADSASPFESVVPASFASDTVRDRAAILFVGQSPGVTALPAPSNESPPADPEMPAWGNYLDPAIAPIVAQPIQYDLVGPPKGVIQNIEGQDYQAVISDPNTVLNLDSRFGQTIDVFRPDGMGPIGLFGDHTLPVGTAFVSYRYLQNSFDQNYSGSHRIGVPTSYPLAPTRMLQDSQVALVEYGVTQDLTMMAYLPFQHNEINFQTATGGEKQAFTNPGDIRIMALLTVARSEQSQSHLNLGLSLPVGFLEQLTSFEGTPSAVPYQLQTSSGTYDLLGGYTYRRQTENWTFGAQANAVIPTGKNTLGFELGNQFQLTGWISRRWTDRWSTSARLDAHDQGNIRGDDDRLNVTLSPVNQTNAQARQYVNGLLGVNYLFSRPGHRIREQRLFLESGVPLYQWVDGPQLGLSWTLNAGYGMTF